MSEQWEIILCPICREVIHRHYAAPIESRARISSRAPAGHASNMLTLMMEEANRMHEELVLKAEEACASHFRERHPLRLRLWKKLKWNWVLNRRFPWQRHSAPEFDFSRRARS